MARRRTQGVEVKGMEVRGPVKEVYVFSVDIFDEWLCGAVAIVCDPLRCFAVLTSPLRYLVVLVRGVSDWNESGEEKYVA